MPHKLCVIGVVGHERDEFIGHVIRFFLRFCKHYLNLVYRSKKNLNSANGTCINVFRCDNDSVRGLYPIAISFITHYVRFKNSSIFDIKQDHQGLF